MFTPGPRRKCTPLARAARLSCVPIRSASVGFHVAVNAIPPAMVVAGPKFRTPKGPSAIFRRGRFSLGTARMKNPSTPPRRSIFSSRVISERMESTLRSRADTEGGGANAADCAGVETAAGIRSDRNTIIDQSFAMRFSSFIYYPAHHPVSRSGDKAVWQALSFLLPRPSCSNFFGFAGVDGGALPGLFTTELTSIRDFLRSDLRKSLPLLGIF